jgi:acyl-CoA synthetase (AMP-forming)/AMP-acid ligase II
MKIITANNKCFTRTSLRDKINQYKKELKSKPYVNMLSKEWEDHLAVYTAWQEVGGTVLINNPLNPLDFQTRTLENMDRLSPKDAICFLTSGTTGLNKIVVNKEKQLLHAARVVQSMPGWDPDDPLDYVSTMPAFTSGFWHIVLAPAVMVNKTCTMITPATNPTGLGNVLMTSTGALEQFKLQHPTLNFHGYKYVNAGASQVLPKHADIAFDRGAENFYITYGMSETTSPSLTRVTNIRDKNVDCMDFKPIEGSPYEIKLVDGELWVRGDGVCENAADFNSEDGWFKTNDYFDHVTDDLVRFNGRASDYVQMNGFKASLLVIENVIAESDCINGEVLAVKHNRLGSDYIELKHTDPNIKITIAQIQDLLQDKLPKCNIPRQFTFVDSIPKNPLGKKMRR